MIYYANLGCCTCKIVMEILENTECTCIYNLQTCTY